VRETEAKEELALLRRALRRLDYSMRCFPGGEDPVIAPSGAGDWTIYPANAEVYDHGTQHTHKRTLSEALRATGAPDDQCNALKRALVEE
jgi:hypothetical protein